jgi:hypothetical protein
MRCMHAQIDISYYLPMGTHSLISINNQHLIPIKDVYIYVEAKLNNNCNNVLFFCFPSRSKTGPLYLWRSFIYLNLIFFLINKISRSKTWMNVCGVWILDAKRE